MTTSSGRRILRNYHNKPPGPFHLIDQKVYHSLSEAEFPDSVWGANPGLLATYKAASEKFDIVYHHALNGGKVEIAQRDLLQAQLVNLLDEIALALEGASLRNPEILLVCGFDLGKEQRGRSRKVAVQEKGQGGNAENPA
jgi:hypothetical protein